MAEILLKYNNQISNIRFPDSWNSLVKDQLLFIAEHWKQWKALSLNNQSLIGSKTQLFIQLLPGTRKEKKQYLKKFNELPDEELYELVQLTNFVFEKNTLTNNPSPVIIIGSNEYHGPGDRLKDISAFEFAFADDAFMKHHTTGKDQYLNQLIATIYRPSLPNGDKSGETRVKFNRKLIDQYIKQVEGLDYVSKELILLWYMGCRNHIIDKNQHLFNQENQKEAENKGWISVIMALSAGKFGTFDQTGETDLSLIFMELNELHAQKLKAEANKNKR